MIPNLCSPIWVRCVVVACIAAVSPALMAAQSVVGNVVLGDSSAAANVIVIARDAKGATAARTLTSSGGAFVLRLPAAGTYSVSVLRIGFRPTEGPTVTVAADGRERVRIVATGARVNLLAMAVRERETCRVSADTGLLVARVWEEARKAMLSSALTAESAPAMFAEWISYDRSLDSTGRVVRSQRVTTTRSPTTRAFRSVPAEVLRETGFVVSDETSTTYYAPDADALLSDTFVAGHCFRLVDAPRDSQELVGVSFTPTRDRLHLREIEGTLWLDRASAELRRLEYAYVNLPDAALPARPGGMVQFHRLSDGHWFISRWHVRMPRLGARNQVMDNGLRRLIATSSLTVLRGVEVTGGEVNRAVRGDSVVYRGNGPAIRVQLVTRDRSVEVAGAVVRLEGTDYQAIADSSGRAVLEPVLAGRYRATVSSAQMEFLRTPSLSHELETSMSARVDTLTMPSAREALSKACPKDSVGADEGLLYGRVRDERATSIGGAEVTATWASAFNVIGTGGGDKLQYTERTLRTVSDDTGRWRMCGVPKGAVVTVTVASLTGHDRQRVRMDDRLLASAELVVRKESGAGASNAPGARGELAVVELSVTNERGEALEGVALDVEVRGARRTVVTGVDGSALVPEVPRGRLSVRARKIGYAPGEVELVIEQSRVTAPLVLSATRPPLLDTMRVVTSRLGSRYGAFEARRLNRQATVSITREEIKARNPREIWEMLTNVPGVKVADRDNNVVATSVRAFVNGFSNEPCFLKVVVDGVMLNKLTQAFGGSGFDLRQLPRPEEIHGVEVFNGPASIPLEYGGSGDGKWCGLIAIWTR